MATNKMDAAKKAEIDDFLHRVNASMQTPETMGRILMSALLSQATTKGTLTEEGVIEIPMTATLRLPGSKGIAASSTCGECCITVLGGVKLVCVIMCHHEQ